MHENCSSKAKKVLELEVIFAPLQIIKYKKPYTKRNTVHFNFVWPWFFHGKRTILVQHELQVEVIVGDEVTSVISQVYIGKVSRVFFLWWRFQDDVMYIRLYLSAYEIRCQLSLGFFPCHQRTYRVWLAPNLADAKGWFPSCGNPYRQPWAILLAWNDVYCSQLR